MFDKIKENDYVKKFLDLWMVPRYRALIILGLYIIFFAVVISSFKTDSYVYRPIKNKENALEKYEKMDNYQYSATIENEISKKMSGRVYKDKQLIMLDNNNYYYDGNKLYKKEDSYIEFNENLLEFDIWRFTPKLICELIQNGKLESKTEYADGIKSKTYLVSLVDFIKLYFGDDTTGKESVYVTLYEHDNMITKVELDLTSIYHMQQFSNLYDYKVILEYSLIDGISPIEVNVESSD